MQSLAPEAPGCSHEIMGCDSLMRQQVSDEDVQRAIFALSAHPGRLNNASMALAEGGMDFMLAAAA